LQCVAVCRGVLVACVAVCRSVLQVFVRLFLDCFF